MTDPTYIELDLNIIAEHILPGTSSDEDPNQEIPPGWWVFGYNADGNREGELYIRGWYDIDGNDVSKRVAELIADCLAEVSGQ